MNNKKPPRTCLQVCVSLLEYADNTERQLYEKLEKRGYPRDEIAAAIALLKEKRLFSERDYAFRYAYSAAKNKQWGPRRILLSMREKGFSQENLRAVENALGVHAFDVRALRDAGAEASQEALSPGNDNSAIENLLSTLDFPAICAILMMRVLRAAANAPLREYFESGSISADTTRQKLYASRQKLVAALLRRGFSMDTIRDAEELVREKLREERADEE